MSRAALAYVVGVGLLAGVLLAQTSPPVYNPVGLQFDHDLVGGVDVTDHYQLGFMKDAGENTLLNFLFTHDVPKSILVPSPLPEGATVGTYTIPFERIPALPVGTTYRAVLYAVDAEQRASFPSNITPEAFRFNACALAGAAGVQLPSIAVPTWPELTTGQGVTLTLHLTAPHDVQFVMLDLIGDGLPAWYFVTKVAPGKPATAQVFWGPLPKTGQYEVFAQLIDSGGCQATLPFGTFVSIK